MILFGWILVVATFIYLYKVHAFFREERIKCQKYPFYNLRDKILWTAIEKGGKDHISPTIEKVDWAIDNFRDLNLKFFSDLMTYTMDEFLEEAKKVKFSDKAAFKKAIKKRLPDAFYFEYLRLVLITAQKNNIWIRLAMTKYGTKMFAVWHALKLIVKVLLVVGKEERQAESSRAYQTIQAYSYLRTAIC